MCAGESLWRPYASHGATRKDDDDIMINNINRLTDACTQGHRETAAKIDRQTEWFHIIQKYPIRLVMYLWRVE